MSVAVTVEERAFPTAEEHEPGRGSVTLGELGILTVGLGFALIGWMSLALVHLGAHSGGLAIALALGALAVILLLVGRRRGRPGGLPRVRVDRAELASLAAVAVVAAVLAFPGFPYALTDKDPGVMVAHGFAISRTGDITVDDPVLEAAAEVDVRLTGPGVVLPGFWIDPEDPTRILPQFLHLYPAFLATAIDIAGPAGAWNLNPLLAVVAALAVAAGARRAGAHLVGERAAPLAGGLAGVLLATNMLQVWQAKYPSTEIVAQLLLALALLAIAIALDTGWRAAAGIAGLLVAIGFLARPDGILLILLAAGTGAALVAFRRFEARCWWFLGGFALAFPHAAWQAWVRNENYSLANDVPTAGRLALLVGGLFATGLVGRWVLGTPVIQRTWLRLAGPTPATRHRLTQIVGLALTLLLGAFLALCLLRPRLLGTDFLDYNGVRIPSLDEHNLRRFSWFLTPVGLLLFWLGFSIVALKRWRAATWAILAPSIVLLPVYLWAARISPRLMWWGRRYVPIILPGVVILIALAVTVGLAAAWAAHRRRERTTTAILPGVAAALAVVFLVSIYLSQSLPLRSHEEFGGSYRLGEQIAATAEGREALFLFDLPAGPRPDDPARNFPGAVWFVHDQMSALLPPDPTQAQVDAYALAFRDRPLFVVTSTPSLPVGLTPEAYTLVEEVGAEMPVWQEDNFSRPKRAEVRRDDLWIWARKGNR